MTMILNKEPNTYNMNYDVISSIQNIRDLDNKLFCKIVIITFYFFNI